MRVRFWGTRGSIAAPGSETMRYGGNTACVEVHTDDGTLLIFDCGTGARKLGVSLAQGGPVRAHLFIGHTHSDHIQGLPFFVPAFLPNSHLTIYGPAGVDRSFPTAVSGMMEYAYFPVPITTLAARLEFHELGEGEFCVGDVCVRTQYLNHTAPCLAYRIEVGDSVLVYATDHEPHMVPYWRPDRPEGALRPDLLLHPGDARHAQFLRGADLLIHDAQYTLEEYPAKVGWGHSPMEYAVDVALAAGVRRLALFHHDPTRTDEALEHVMAAATERVRRLGAAMEVLGAAEGAEITLTERAHVAARSQQPTAPPAMGHAQVLVAEDEDDIARLLQDALEQDGYLVQRAVDGVEALELIAANPFDLILLDLSLPEVDGMEVCRALRTDPRTASLPILVLTARTDAVDLLAGFAEGVTDYMTKPFSLAQVRARVNVCLSRLARVQA